MKPKKSLHPKITLNDADERREQKRRERLAKLIERNRIWTEKRIAKRIAKNEPRSKEELEAIYEKKYDFKMKAIGGRRYEVYLLVKSAIEAGVLKKTPCSCGEEKSRFFTRDFDKPLEGVWLCRHHHAGERVKEMKKESISIEIPKYRFDKPAEVSLIEDE